MSIQGIRRIRNGKTGSPERTLLLLPVKENDKAQPLMSADMLIPCGFSFSKSSRVWIKGRAQLSSEEKKHSPVHRKTGSLGPAAQRQQDYVEFISNHIVADLPMPMMNKEAASSQFSNGFKTRRNSRNDTRSDSRQSAYSRPPSQRLDLASRHNFEQKFVAGKGGFGKVWKVREKKSLSVYAMKEMLKTKIIVKKSVDSVMNENALLRKLCHPFLVNMHCAFQDRECLYLIMDYVNGGDLRFHLGLRRRFHEEQAKFFIACIVVGLQYMHANGVIHRDLKPENLVFDEKGYLRITDLGVSRQCKPNNAADTSGTPGYMAPEVITKTNHGFGVDFFAIGVITYELMLGKRPYVGKNRQEIRQQMLARQAKIQGNPYNWSSAAVDFVNKLLIRKQEHRLGCNGVYQLKTHAWLRDFDWKGLLKKQILPPYIPIVPVWLIQTIQENYESYQECISEDSSTGLDSESLLLLRDPKVQELFDGYAYHRPTNRSRTPIL